MIHTQNDSGTFQPLRFYAYCPCGVCSPLRREIEAAEADDETHASVCSTSTPKGWRFPHWAVGLAAWPDDREPINPAVKMAADLIRERDA